MSTPSLRGLACYRRTFDKNAAHFRAFGRERWFLATRFLRRAVKQGQPGLAWDFVRALDPVVFRVGAAAYLLAKSIVHSSRRSAAGE